MKIRQCPVLPLLVLAAGCMAAPPDDFGASSLPIVDGTRETGRPEVVFLYNLRGSACTASIIPPYVVLTAAHCVGGPASAFRVYVGSSTRSFTAEYRVADVRVAPRQGETGDDLAVLVLAAAARETPIELGRERPSSLLGQTVTAVGYGQTPAGGSGTKYTTTMGVDGVSGGTIFVEPSVCSGDSGGPLIGEDGRVYGVASFIYTRDGTSPTCGTAPGAYNEIYRHLDFIDQVLEETGTCVPDGEEACNGADDDCDGSVDEGCVPLGQPCVTSDECVGGLCADTAIGRICTSECDSLRPDQGCGLGFYCAHSGGCAGHCVPGEAGTLGNGVECSADTDCVSLFCSDPGDGRRRCLDPCRADAGLCFAGEVCAAVPGGCGACVPETLLAARHGLGEPCEVDEDCREGMACRDHGGVRECVGPCAGGECGEGFECRDGVCVTDRTQGVGGVCIDNLDCGDAFCAALADRRWCTAQCAGPEDCPSGFDCVPAGGVTVCAPVASLDGETCATNDDCASGLCASAGGERFCTSYCDRRDRCAPGFDCVRTSADSSGGVCVAASGEPEETGGCSISEHRRRSALPGFAALLAVLLLVSRRRR